MHPSNGGPELSTCGSKRMSHCNGPAIDIDLFLVKVQMIAAEGGLHHNEGSTQHPGHFMQLSRTLEHPEVSLI